MIILYLGNVGSGKTVSAVREMVLDKTERIYFTNIFIKKSKNIKKLLPEHLFLKKQIGEKKVSGQKVPVYDLKLNIDFWKSFKVPVNIVLDEFHNIANARSSMSKKNKVFNTWLSMIRRVLGSTSAGYGNLIIISQLSNQVDIIARQLCHQVRFHICHFSKRCNNCGFRWNENSEQPEQKTECPICNSPKIIKYNHRVEVYCFFGMDAFHAWKDFSANSFYRHFFINDIEEYFKFYDTLQWDNLFEEL